MNTELWKPDTEITLTSTGKEKRYQLKQRLGAGKTSVVWLAEEGQENRAGEESAFSGESHAEQRQETQENKEVVLKVLHTATEQQWRDAFEDEIQVLRDLAENGLPAVPALYDVSKEGDSPAFMAMEYVDYPPAEDLARPEYWLNETVQEITKASDWLSYQVQLLQERISKLPDVKQMQPDLADLNTDTLTTISNLPDVKQMQGDLSQVPTQAQLIKGTLQKLDAATKQWDEAHKGLSELEVVQIGCQVCEVLQKLHVLGRGYKDFQLKNIRWNRPARKVKIIDWNVVTKTGSIDINRNTGLDLIHNDLTILAQNLFYLRTLVLPPPKASVDILRHYGGEVWRRSSDLFQMVLEKALHPEEQKRFQWAYRSEDDNESLGVSLRKVSIWLELQATALVEEAEKLEPKDEWVLALCQLAEDKLGQHDIPEQSDTKDRIKTLREQVRQGAPDLRSIENLVKATSYNDALAVLNGIDEASLSLMQRRWKHALQGWVLVKNPVEFDKYKASSYLIQGMQALEIKNWTEAREAFEELGRAFGESVDFPKRLQIDAEVGAKLQQVEWEWARLQEILPRYSGQISLKEPAGKILSLLDNIDRKLGIADQTGISAGSNESGLGNGSLTDSAQHPYADAIWSDWPQSGIWRETAQKVVNDADQNMAEANQVAAEVQDKSEPAERWQVLEKGLMKLPGNDILLRQEIEWATAQLKEGRPDVALPFLELCLRYAGSSVYFGELRRYRQLAADWLQLREIIGKEQNLAKTLVLRLVRSIGENEIIRTKIFEEIAQMRIVPQDGIVAVAKEDQAR